MMELFTNRLCLRSFHAEDALGALSWLGDPEAMRYIEPVFDKAKADENGEISLLDYLSDELIEKAIITLSGVELLTVVNIVWAMAKNEDPTLKEKPQEWVNQFDVFPYDIVVKEIAEVIIESSVSSKNSQRLLSNLKKTQLA